MMQKAIKYTLTLIFFVFTYSHGFSQKAFSINDIPLTWRNFVKKDTSKNAHIAAQTYVTIDIEYDLYEVSKNKQELVIKIMINQNRDKSWVSKQFLMKATDDASLKLLNHEKLHYVVNLIGFKKLYNDLESATFTSEYKTEITSIFRKNIREIDKSNANYDKQTYHGTSLKNQTKWEENLMNEFNSLYKNDNNIKTEYTIKTYLQ